MRRSLAWLAAPLFLGCPWEFSCVTVDPRPPPASLAQANEELVDGLAHCGYVSEGRRGSITLVRVRTPTSPDALMPCVRACLHPLRDNCEELAQMACLGMVPEQLTNCARDCNTTTCTDAISTNRPDCGSVSLRCGIGIEGLAPLTESTMHHRSFACRDGSGAITAEHVCDFVEDCPDGSDEGLTLGCARLSCADADDLLDD